MANAFKPVLVLLPGMMCDRRLFAPQIAAFSGSFDITVADIGQHDTIEKIAGSILGNTDAHGIAVCGLSMGGIVAMEMIRQQPERISRMILMDTNHLADTEERRQTRQRQMADVRRGELRRVIVDEMKPVYLAPANRGNQSLLDLLVDMAMDLGPDVFFNQSAALMQRSDASDILARWDKPALLLCGAEDELCPPERHAQMAELMRNAELCLIENAGHISTLEQPDRVNELIGIFLAA